MKFLEEKDEDKYIEAYEIKIIINRRKIKLKTRT